MLFVVSCSSAHLHAAGTGAAARGARGRVLRSTLHLRWRAAVARCRAGCWLFPRKRLSHCLWHSCLLRLAHAFHAVGSCTCDTDEAQLRSLYSVLMHAHAGNAQAL